MSTHQYLGQVSSLQQMLVQLLQQSPTITSNQQRPPVDWYFGRSIYLELEMVRGLLLDDHDLAGRVSHLFQDDSPTNPSCWLDLPPRDHLLNWALEIHEQDLTLLANPRQLPEATSDQLAGVLLVLVQQLALGYESMIACRMREESEQPGAYRVAQPLQPGASSTDRIEHPRTHFRVGPSRPEQALDGELPPQLAELDAFAIATRPVSNGDWLRFMQESGMQGHRPLNWRQDTAGNWFGLGLGGPYPLDAGQPVSGIDWHQACAYAEWQARQPGFEGAALPHEFQLEIINRQHPPESGLEVISWCSNLCLPYDGYQPAVQQALRSQLIDGSRRAQRGFSIHSPLPLKRSSLRRAAHPDRQAPLAGLRLIYPPGAD